MDKKVTEDVYGMLVPPYEEEMLLLDTNEIMVLQRMVLHYNVEKITGELLPYINPAKISKVIERIYSKCYLLGFSDEMTRWHYARYMWDEYHEGRKILEKSRPRNSKKVQNAREEEYVNHTFEDDDLLKIVKKLPTLARREKELANCLTETFDAKLIAKRLGVKSLTVHAALSTLFTKSLELSPHFSHKERRALVRAAVLKSKELEAF